MAYTKKEWRARQGTGLNKFTKSQETADTVVLQNTPDLVTEPGTPFDAGSMNHIEQGIADAHNMADSKQDKLTATGATNLLTAPASAGGQPGAKAIADFVQKSEVVNNLTSASANTPLSAAQGKFLSDIKENKSNKGAASGYASLDASAKVPLSQISDAILGQMLHAGSVNASTAVATLTTNGKTILGTTAGTITLTNNTAATTGYTANQGNYFLISAAGTFAGISFDVGDWLVANASGWDKIDNTDTVKRVNGKIGDVNLTYADVGAQRELDRTVGGNDNATGTVADTGDNLSVPIPVTTVASAASNVQTTAGTRSLRAQIKILIDNIAHLFANMLPKAGGTMTGRIMGANLKGSWISAVNGANAAFAVPPNDATSSQAQGVLAWRTAQGDAYAIANLNGENRSYLRYATKANIDSAINTTAEVARFEDGEFRLPAKGGAIAASSSPAAPGTQRPATEGQVAATRQAILNEKGAANGIATLDANGRVPASQLPLASGGTIAIDSSLKGDGSPGNPLGVNFSPVTPMAPLSPGSPGAGSQVSRGDHVHPVDPPFPNINSVATDVTIQKTPVVSFPAVGSTATLYGFSNDSNPEMGRGSRIVIVGGLPAYTASTLYAHPGTWRLEKLGTTGSGCLNILNKNSTLKRIA